MGLSIASINDGVFTEIQEELGFLQQGSFRSVVPFHWNDDGILDYWITDVEEPSQLMVSSGCNENAWLYITGPTGTSISFISDEKQYYGELNGASSYAASISPQLHFGLGPVSNITEVKMREPGGSWELIADSMEVPAKLSLWSQE